MKTLDKIETLLENVSTKKNSVDSSRLIWLTKEIKIVFPAADIVAWDLVFDRFEVTMSLKDAPTTVDMKKLECNVKNKYGVRRMSYNWEVKPPVREVKVNIVFNF